jgi:hypothetical protein
MAKVDQCAAAAKLANFFIFHGIGAAHPETSVQQHVSETGHSAAARADQIYSRAGTSFGQHFTNLFRA